MRVLLLSLLVACNGSAPERLPPPPAIALSVSPVVPGSPATIELTGLAPNERFWLLRARGEFGPGTCVPGTTTCLGIDGNASVLATVDHGSGTEATLTVPVPASVPAGASVGLQVVQALGGTYVLSNPVLRTTTSYVCGDGVVAGPETCDDGNVVSGDGCDGVCELESTPRWSVEVEPEGDPSFFAGSIDAAATPDGGFVVGASTVTRVGSSYVYADRVIRWDGMGEEVYTTAVAIDSGSALGLRPRIVALEDGSVVLAKLKGDNGNHRPVIVHLGPDGSEIATFELSDAGDGWLRGIDIAVRDDGDLLVLWNSDAGTGNCMNLVTLTLDGDVEHATRHCASGDATGRAVAMRDGAIFLGWNSEDTFGVARLGPDHTVQAHTAVTAGTEAGTFFNYGDAVLVDLILPDDGTVILGGYHAASNVSSDLTSGVSNSLTVVYDRELNLIGGTDLRPVFGTSGGWMQGFAHKDGQTTVVGKNVFAQYDDNGMRWWGAAGTRGEGRALVHARGSDDLLYAALPLASGNNVSTMELTRMPAAPDDLCDYAEDPAPDFTPTAPRPPLVTSLSGAPQTISVSTPLRTIAPAALTYLGTCTP